MDQRLISELTQQLFKETNLSNLGKLYSSLVWNKIGFCRNGNRFKIGETTVTQNLVFDFWLMAKTATFPIEIFESSDERANGNDLEIFVETRRGYFLIPTQAKIIKKGSNYPSIKHKVGGIDQVDLLLNYAKTKGAVPMYLFYNYVDWYSLSQRLKNFDHFDCDQYGCSFVPAQYIKDNFQNKKKTRQGTTSWVIPNFYDLHPNIATPFHILFDLNKESLLLDICNVPFVEGQEIKFYSRDEIYDDLQWKNLAPPPSIGRITPNAKEYGKMKTELSSKQHQFNPRFRIMLSVEKRETAIYEVS